MPSSRRDPQTDQMKDSCGPLAIWVFRSLNKNSKPARKGVCAAKMALVAYLWIASARLGPK